MIKSYIKEKHYIIVLNQKTIAKTRPNLYWELKVLLKVLPGLQFTA